MTITNSFLLYSKSFSASAPRYNKIIITYFNLNALPGVTGRFSDRNLHLYFFLYGGRAKQHTLFVDPSSPKTDEQSISSY